MFAALLLLVGAAAVAAGPLSGNFSQYHSVIVRYQGAGAMADWGTAPFGGTINGTRYLAACDCFVVLTSNNSGFGLWTIAATAIASPVTTFQPTFAPTQCMLSGPDTTRSVLWVTCTDGSDGVFDYKCNYSTGHGIVCAADSRYESAALTAGAELLDVARYQTLNGSNFLLLASSAALEVCLVIPNSTVGACQAVPMANTTGVVITSHNVARIWCFDVAYQTAPKDYMGGRCFAVSRNVKCDDNICPADLVHVLDAALNAIRYIRVPGVIDAWPQGIAYDPLVDGVHFADSAAVNTLHRNGSLNRVGGLHGGLPQAGLTSADAGPHGAWFGSENGAMARLPDGSWKYFYGPRWLPGPDAAPSDAMYVTSVSVSGATGTTLVVTRTGYSVIALTSWTLHDKAEHLASYMPLFYRWGLSPATNRLTEWGVAASAVSTENANEGLWTSIYLGSQAFRYAVTGDATAKKNAWEAFNGMRSLCTVTGIRGLCARELTNHSRPLSEQWYPSPTMEGWYFNGNPSSDEYTGHLHIYPIMHDLVAETAEEKQLVSDLIANLTSHLVDHGLILYDVTGKPTQWGRWDPHTLNDRPHWYDERGLNSMQILGFLSAAYRITGNETYAAVFMDLVDNHGYSENMINLKITQPSDVDFSDDELTFLAYMGLLWSARPSDKMATNRLWERVKDDARVSMQRTYDYVHRERPDLWALMYLMMFNASDASPGFAPSTDEAIADARYCLQTWPTSIIAWPSNNSARLDVQWSPYPNRNGELHMLLATQLPYDEIAFLNWNSDPFRKWAGSAGQVTNPSFFLYPYWLARWLNLA
jgi:hypothetical protein